MNAKVLEFLLFDKTSELNFFNNRCTIDLRTLSNILLKDIEEIKNDLFMNKVIFFSKEIEESLTPLGILVNFSQNILTIKTSTYYIRVVLLYTMLPSKQNIIVSISQNDAVWSIGQKKSFELQYNINKERIVYDNIKVVNHPLSQSSIEFPYTPSQVFVENVLTGVDHHDIPGFFDLNLGAVREILTKELKEVIHLYKTVLCKDTLVSIDYKKILWNICLKKWEELSINVEIREYGGKQIQILGMGTRLSTKVNTVLFKSQNDGILINYTDGCNDASALISQYKGNN